MSEIRERRYSQRHHFPDSKVACREKMILRLFNQYSEPLPLIDLNRSGLGFQADKNYTYGDRLHLKIEINGHQKIHLVGEVRWISSENVENRKNIGVQFLPFGTIKGYNSFSAREKLNRLISPLENYTPGEEVQVH